MRRRSKELLILQVFNEYFLFDFSEFLNVEFKLMIGLLILVAYMYDFLFLNNIVLGD